VSIRVQQVKGSQGFGMRQVRVWGSNSVLVAFEMAKNKKFRPKEDIT
jgi:hypothetical protein